MAFRVRQITPREERTARELKLTFLIVFSVLFAVFALIFWVVSASAAPSSDHEFKACHAGDRAACKRQRVEDCRHGEQSACDYDKAQKQDDPYQWCGQRYKEAWQYRYCLNGSPDR